MTETPLTPEAKERVVAALLAHETGERDALSSAVRAEEDAAHVDPDDPRDVGDRAQADEAAQLHALVERSEAEQEATVERIRALDFSPTDVVRPGAVVGFDGRRYVVGVVADAFECDGATYEGIAADSPVHDALVGLRAGEAFTWDGREHRIDLVL